MCVHIGGTIANSLAVMTDALHLLTDLVGIVLSLGAMWLAQRPGPLRLPFGLYRAGRPHMHTTGPHNDTHYRRGVTKLVMLDHAAMQSVMVILCNTICFI